MTIQHSIKGKVKIEKFEAEFVNGEWVPIKLVDTIEHHNRITIDLVRQKMEGQSAGLERFCSIQGVFWQWKVRHDAWSRMEYLAAGPIQGPGLRSVPASIFPGWQARHPHRKLARGGQL